MVDNQLIMALRLAKEGRKEGFQFLYEKTCGEALCEAMELMNDAAGAQMAVQQAYQQVFDQIQEVAQPEMFQPWLLDMTAYFAMQQVRMRGTFQEPEEMTFRLEEDDMSITEPLDDAEVMAVYSAEEADNVLTQLLSELTEAEKVCMIMYYQNKKTVAQVAQTIGCTEQAAENWIASGKKKVMHATGMLEQDDTWRRWEAIPFLLSLLHIKTVNMTASGVIGTQAVFQIAGTTMTFGSAASAGSTAGAAGVAGNAVVGNAGTVAASTGTAVGKGFLHTMAGKIVAGVAAAAIVGGTAGGILYHNAHKKPAETTEVTTEVSTTEMVEETTTEATTEEVKDETYKKAYLTVLRDHESAIRGYTQERNSLESTEWTGNYEEPAPVAIEDVTGDDIPELIYIENTQVQGDYTVTAALSIYTCEKGKVKRIYYLDSWDVHIAGGATYSLFKVDGDSRLYTCNGMADSFTDENFSRLDVQADGSLAATQILNRHVDMDGPENRETCKADGQAVSSEEFQTKLDELTGRMTKLLPYNGVRDNTMRENMKKAEQAYLTYDEAIALLSDGQETQSAGQTDGKLPFSQAQGFFFSSGVGAWSTGLTINPDGSFSGDFHDSDMGSSGDGYDSTVYVCSFRGTFKDIQKKDDYTYTMKIDTLEVDTSDGEWIEEHDGVRIRYVGSGPYGIEGGTNFELYLPGKPISSLTAEYCSWVWLDDGVTTLPWYGFYNVEQQEGFRGDN